MKPEAQRIAIAEACGWTESKDGWWSHPTLPCNGGADPDPPDYLGDLNAMHEAERTIRQDHDKWGVYLVQLSRTAPECRVFAAASQKAEAFLRTLNLWKEEAS
jgi:hypothetical protein